MSGYLAKRLVKIEGVDYEPGDVVPTSALLPDEFKSLVRRGHIGDVEQNPEIAVAVDAAIAALIDGSPETLDTLNELAAAINDDPDFFNNLPKNNEKALVVKTEAYLLTVNDHVVVCSGSWSATLPTAAGIAGQEFIIQNSGTGTITVTPDGSETINGAATQTLNQWESLTIVSDGTNWIII